VVAAACVAWLAAGLRPERDRTGDFRVHAFGRRPVAFQGRVQPYDALARNSLRVLSGRETIDGTPAIRWLLDAISGSDAAERHRVFRIVNPEVIERLGLEPRAGYRYSIAELRPGLGALFQDAEAARGRAERGGAVETYDGQIVALAQRANLYLSLASAPHPVPGEDAWRPVSEAPGHPVTLAMGDALAAWRAGDAGAFNAAVERLETLPTPGASAARLRVESAFAATQPFYRCAVLYLLAFVLCAAAWVGWSATLNRTAAALVVVAFVVHTAALAVRVWLSGRPPVTNLYSSAVFAGWGAVLAGVLVERSTRAGLGATAASACGFVTLLIAHFLSLDGDTMKVLQAVLDTNFWLATHVVCITLGYATTYFAGLLGIIYIARALVLRAPDPSTARTLSGLIYGTLCFALFFSFVGTVLGGLWADDSWGRFWGWDPKENGALIIVLWNALILHARWGGLARERGVAVMAVFGNVVTSWSWFGTNALGVGLHAYGQAETTVRWLAWFVISQLAVMALGALARCAGRTETSREPAP
jgi:ABC-type transport system involved in cytochrome c biogenesis permease subunit